MTITSTGAILCLIASAFVVACINLIYRKLICMQLKRNLSLDNFVDGVLNSKAILDKLLYIQRSGTVISYESYKKHCQLIDMLIEISNAMNCRIRIVIAHEIKRVFLEIKHEEEECTKCM